MMIWMLAGLGIGVVAVLVVLQVLVLRQNRQLVAAVTTAHQRQDELLKQQHALTTELARSLLALDKRVGQTQRRQQALESRENGSATYAQASKLIQMGADPAELARSCGLSQAETRLVSLLAARGIKPAADA